MGETSIPWCHYTFNPWSGCSRVSPACDHCYAASLPAARRRGAEWGDHPRVMASESYWRQPMAWNRKAEREGKRIKVFCGSTCDVFDDTPVSKYPRIRLFELIHLTPHLDWLLLTKRPHVMVDYARVIDWPTNAWAGVTAENQTMADERIPLLLQVPARVRFVSVEPMLGPVDLRHFRFREPNRFGGYNALTGRLHIHTHRPDSESEWQDTDYEESRGKLGWVICGGESGPHARPMHPEWVRGLRDQCQAAGVPFFFKQWGEWVTEEQSPEDIVLPATSKWGMWTGKDTDPDVYHVGTRSSGHLLDGREWRETPHA